MNIETLISMAESKVDSGDLLGGLDLFISARDSAFKSGDLTYYIRCCQAAAVVLDKLKRYDEAVASLDLAITASTLDVVTTSGLLINKGVCLVKMKLWRRAWSTFKQAASNVRTVPGRLRTQEMHHLIDDAENSAWTVEDIIKAEAEGKVVTINPDEEGK